MAAALDEELTAGSVFLDVPDDALGELDVAPSAHSTESTPQRAALTRVARSPHTQAAHARSAVPTSPPLPPQELASSFDGAGASFEQTTDALDTSLVTGHAGSAAAADVDEFEALERLVAAEAIAAPPPAPVTVASMLSAHRAPPLPPPPTRIVEKPDITTLPAVTAPAVVPAPITDDDAMDLNSVVVGFRRALRDKTERTGVLQPPQATVNKLPESSAHVDAAARIRARLHETVAMTSSYTAAVHDLNQSRASSEGARGMYDDLSDDNAEEEQQDAPPLRQQQFRQGQHDQLALAQRIRSTPTPSVPQARELVSRELPRAPAAVPSSSATLAATSAAAEAPMRRSAAGVAWTFGTDADLESAAASIQSRFHQRMSPPPAQPEPKPAGTAPRETNARVAPVPPAASVPPVEEAPAPSPVSRIPVATGVVHSPPTPAVKRPARSAAAAGILALAPRIPGMEESPTEVAGEQESTLSSALTAPAVAQVAAAASAPSNDLASAIEAKVAALNAQIVRYQEEVLRLQAAQTALLADKQELESANAALVKERIDFRAWKAAETARLEEWKADATSKIERERRVAVRQARAAASASTSLDRHDKAELDELRTSVAKLRSELHAADARYKASVERHRSASTAAAERIATLEAQVLHYEEERIGKAFSSSQAAASSAATATASSHNRSSSLGASRNGGGGSGSRRGSMSGAAAKSNSVDIGSISKTPAVSRSGPRTQSSATSVRVVTRGTAAGAASDAVDGSTYALQHAARRRVERHAGGADITAAGAAAYDPDRYAGGAGDAVDASYMAVNSSNSPSASAHSSAKQPTRAPPAAAIMATHEPPNLRAATAVQVEVTEIESVLSSSEPARMPVAPVAARFRVPAGASRQLQAHMQLARHAHNVSEGHAVSLAPQQERELGGGKKELVYSDGTRIVQFRNGTEKEHHEDGTVIIRFNNGDVKRTVPLPAAQAAAFAATPGACAELYYYADSQTLQATYPNDVEVFEFANGQLELHRRTRGEKEVVFSDGELQTFKIEGGGADGTLPTSTLRV